ncbi:MAG: hypothetical protein ABL931_00200 [Usitatibacteraceae bacterium]
MTYGDIKAMLETEEDFSTIFATRIGFVAGTLMDRLQAVDPSAPLINVLVVNQIDRQPSKGAGSYMAKRFGVPKLKEGQAKQKHPVLWEKYYRRSAAEVYAYPAKQWAKLFKKAFSEAYTLDEIVTERAERKQGTERDGIRYGRGGEGPEHRALREWVTANPGAIRKAFASARTETESDLYSGDRVDSVFYCEDRTVVVEVKSRISNEIDMRRGVYQCVKYRAVKEAMDVRDNPVVDAFLVTETEVSGEIKALLKLHKIKHFIAPQDRK